MNKWFVKGKTCTCHLTEKLNVRARVHLSVLQLVKGVRYTITVELSNTQCKKSAMLRTCDFYPEAHKLKVRLRVCGRETESVVYVIVLI